MWQSKVKGKRLDELVFILSL